MPKPAVSPPVSHTTTACPLDCPDACTLTVSLRGGRITKIDGDPSNPVTRGYICAKVRRFDKRVYGDDRLRYPAVRRGPKGRGMFRRIDWDEALDLLAERILTTRDTHGGEAILPVSYGGSNGLISQDTTDALLFRRLGASRLRRAVCAAPTGAALEHLYGRMASVTYQDFADARLIIVWGANPGVSAIHLMPFIADARKRGATIVVIDPRATGLARQADMHLAVRPGTDVVVALALHRYLFEEGHADAAFLDEHAVGAEALRERAEPWTFARAAETSGISEVELRQLAEMYVRTSPALIRCGWGVERNRNGGSAAAAILALPAVAGKFGVRGGGFAMTNSVAWGIERTWLTDEEPSTRVVNMNRLGRELTEPSGPPIDLLFVYNSNPAVTLPDQNRILQGLAREDLFTVVFDQVLTDTALYADLVLPATTFLEHYDVAKGYGPISLQLVRPVIDPEGEARSNADVFGALLQRLDLGREDDGTSELDVAVQVMDALPEPHGNELRTDGMATPPFDGRPVQFVDIFPGTADGKVHLCPPALDREAPLGLYGYQPDPASDAYPLALISPASDRTISSTLGELSRPGLVLDVHPRDAEARGIEDGDAVRVFNDLGEMRLDAHVTPLVRQGTVSTPKGVWRRHMSGGHTSNALVPDTLADLGGGACFNDARVQVQRVKEKISGVSGGPTPPVARS